MLSNLARLPSPFRVASTALSVALATPTPNDISGWNFRFVEHWYFLATLVDPIANPDLFGFAMTKCKEWLLTPNSHTRQQLKELYDFKLKLKSNPSVFQRLQSKAPGLLDHMIKELVFFMNLIDGQLTVQDELNFYLEEAAEHTGLAAKLLERDPGLSLANEEIADTLKDRIGFPPSLQTLNIVHSGNAAAQDLLKLIESGQIQTDLTSLMLKHEIDEAQMGERKLNLLLRSFV